MLVTPIAAAIIALGAPLGGFTASSDADAPATVQQRTGAVAPLTDVVVFAFPDNNGNG